MNIFYKIIATILAFFVYFPMGNVADYSPKNEAPELVFSVLSDVHMEGNNTERFNLQLNYLSLAFNKGLTRRNTVYFRFCTATVRMSVSYLIDGRSFSTSA